MRESKRQKEKRLPTRQPHLFLRCRFLDYAVLFTMFLDGARPPFCTSAILVEAPSAASWAAVSPSEARPLVAGDPDDSRVGVDAAWAWDRLEIALIGYFIVFIFRGHKHPRANLLMKCVGMADTAPSRYRMTVLIVRPPCDTQ
jgi:hypothetical protein